MKFTARRTIGIKLAIVVAAGVFAVLIFVVNVRQKVEASAFGPSPSHTNAPGEDNCTACHTNFVVNSGSGSVQITGIPHDYIPGQQYPVTVKTSQDDATIYGFQLTAIDNQGKQAGTLSFPVITTPIMQLVTGTVGGNLRKYLEHTSDGTFTDNVFGSNTWAFTWTAPSQRIGKIDFYSAGNAANSDGRPDGDYIYTTSRTSLSGSATSNFDGDVGSDIAVFRPSTGQWTSYSVLNNTNQTYVLGGRGDKIVPGDYDGDGKTDFALFRPSDSTWYLRTKGGTFTTRSFGVSGDIPAAADYNGDGKTDIAVFRPSTGVWYIASSDSLNSFTTIPLGESGDKPVSADYDGDGKADIAVWRPSNGTWYVQGSGGYYFTATWGEAADLPAQADYDGDGKTDFAVFRSGTWYLLRTTDGILVQQFGVAGDIPSTGDFDGDGRYDMTVFRPSDGNWYLSQSQAGYTIRTFGVANDKPVPSGYLPQ